MKTFSISAVGKYRDTLTWRSLDGGTKSHEMPWRTNQVQDSGLKIVVSQLIGAPSMTSGSFSNVLPLRYMAVGSGDPTWDAVSPSAVSKDTAATTLLNETHRFALSADDFAFLDSSGIDLDPQALSARFMARITLGANDANGDLREFGLVGASATSSLNTGLLFNWINHPLIQKDSSLVITREVDISFSIYRG